MGSLEFYLNFVVFTITLHICSCHEYSRQDYYQSAQISNIKTNLTFPKIVEEANQLGSEVYKTFPQFYNKAEGQSCTFSEGRIKCRDKYSEVGKENFGKSKYQQKIKSYGNDGLQRQLTEGTGGGDGGLEDYIGLLGLLGLKGLKGLASVAPLLALPLLLPLFPVLLPLLLLPLLLPLLLLLFVPIPVVTSGRSAGFEPMLELVEGVLNSGECVERISCEISALGKSLDASSFAEKIASLVLNDSKYKTKISDGEKWGRGLSSGDSCRKFNCNIPNLKLTFFEKNQIENR